MIVSGHDSCWGTNVSGHNSVWAQFCLGPIMYGHKRGGTRITDAHGVAAFDFATVADCSQLIDGPTHTAGAVWDLVLTNVPDLYNVNLRGNVVRSDNYLELRWIYHRLLLDSMYLAGFSSSPELIGMPFVRLYLDLIGEVFSEVRQWFRIFIWKSEELWSDLFLWLQWGEEEGTQLGLMVFVGVRLSWSSWRILVGTGTVMLWTEIYSVKHEELLINSMRLRRLVTLLIAIGILMIVPLLMLRGVLLRVMCLVRNQLDVPPLCSHGGLLVSDPAGKVDLLRQEKKLKHLQVLTTNFSFLQFKHKAPVINPVKGSTESYLAHNTCPIPFDQYWRCLKEHHRSHDSKQSWDIVELPHTRHPRAAFCGIAFRAREAERHLMDLVWLLPYIFSEDYFYSCPETESTFS